MQATNGKKIHFNTKVVLFKLLKKLDKGPCVHGTQIVVHSHSVLVKPECHAVFVLCTEKSAKRKTTKTPTPAPTAAAVSVAPETPGN